MQKIVSRINSVCKEGAHRELRKYCMALLSTPFTFRRFFSGMITFCIIAMLASCKQESAQFSEIPQITLTEVQQQKLNGKDSIVNITLHYQDGDGDIGLNTDDTLPPFNYTSKYFYNILVSVYRVDNGKVSKVTTPVFPPNPPDTINYNDRITNLTPTGKSKSISGEIRMFIKSLPYPGVTPDSMFYTFQLIDRALHQSNVVKTNTMLFEF